MKIVLVDEFNVNLTPFANENHANIFVDLTIGFIALIQWEGLL